MENKSLDDIEKELAEKQQNENVIIIEQNKTLSNDENQSLQNQKNETSIVVSDSINNKLQSIFEETVEQNTEDVKSLADVAVKTELEIKNEEIVGRKEVKKSEIRKDVTFAKIDEDRAKHTRAETILKSQGLTNPLPSIYRMTALIVGYPFYLMYLLTFGWIIQIMTFVVKGFIIMVADGAEQFADVNKKFIENDNTKQFKLGKAMINT